MHRCLPSKCIDVSVKRHFVPCYFCTVSFQPFITNTKFAIKQCHHTLSACDHAFAMLLTYYYQFELVLKKFSACLLIVFK